jgi:hypothetical protein
MLATAMSTLPRNIAPSNAASAHAGCDAIERARSPAGGRTAAWFAAITVFSLVFITDEDGAGNGNVRSNPE